MDCVVKIQRPLSDPKGPWLVYDQQRSVHALIPRREIPTNVASDMGSSVKIYYHAVTQAGAPGVRFVCPASDQAW